MERAGTLPLEDEEEEEGTEEMEELSKEEPSIAWAKMCSRNENISSFTLAGNSCSIGRYAKNELQIEDKRYIYIYIYIQSNLLD